MHRRSGTKLRNAKSSLKLLALIIGALGLAFAALVVRLSTGPISVAFLTPYLQDVLAFDRQDIHLKFDNTVLALEGVQADDSDPPSIKIRIINVRVYDAGGKQLISMPSGGVSLSIRALFHGMIAPSTVEISGPRININWQGEDFFKASADDDFLANFPEVVDEASAKIIPFFVRQLLSPRDYSTAAAYLRRVRIVHAEVNLHEEISGSDWKLPDARLELARGAKGLSLRAYASLDKARMKGVSIKAFGNFDAKTRSTDLNIRFQGFNPAAFAGDSASMTAFRAVNMPIDGRLFLNLGPDHRIMTAGLDVDAGGGVIVLPRLYPTPVHFDDVKISGKYDRAKRHFTVDHFSLAFGAARFDGEGLIYPGAGAPGLRLTGDISALPLKALKDYWPHKLAAGGYDWVTRNITAGTATSGTLKLNVTPEMWARAYLPPEALDFQFNFEGVEAHYLRPMPPITDGRGYAKLNAQRFDLTVAAAKVAGLSMRESHVSFMDLHLPKKTLALIDAELDGPLTKALILIDHEPLGYPTEYGLVPETVSGSAVTRLKLSFPLKKSIMLRDVQFDVAASLGHVTIPRLFETIGLDQGVLQMQVDRAGIHAKGKMALNGVPFDFSWKEDFSGNPAYPTKYTLAGNVADHQWTALGLPAAEFVKGPAHVHLTLWGQVTKVAGGAARLDFTKPELSVTRMGWSKPAGAPAGVTLKLERREDEKLNISDIQYKDAHIQASGALLLSAQDDLEKATLASFSGYGVNLAASLMRDEKNHYDVLLNADHFDARPVIKKLTENRPGDSNLSLPDFTIASRVDRVTAEDGVEVKDFRVSAKYAANLWLNVAVKGDLKNSKSFSYDLYGAGLGRKLKVASDDAGELARAFGLFHNAIGGALSVDADLKGSGESQSLKGDIQITDFRIIDTPVLGNILTIGSLTGVSDLLKGDGIAFERLDIPFAMQKGAVTLEKSRAYGPAMGLTMEGGVDLRYDSITLNGTIVPSYTLNSVLKMVPVVGDLLMGGKGEGLFALTYKITGPVAAPKVDVNPLAVLAPGFLRNIVETFQGAGRTISPEREAAEKKARLKKAKVKKVAVETGAKP